MSTHPQIPRMEFGGGGGIIESFPDSFRTAGRDQSPVRHRGSIQLTPGDPVIRETAGNRARKISPGNERRQVGSAEVRGGWGWKRCLWQREDEKGERRSEEDELETRMERGRKRQRRTSS